MQGKTIVVTGGTSGIGQAGAEKLAEMGGRILLIARDKEKAAATLEVLKQRNPDAAHGAYYADLSLVSEMKRVATEIMTKESRIDILVNNAGAVFLHRNLTSEGFEKTFAINHLSYFVLSLALLPLLRKSSNARIVMTASDAHKWGKADFDNLQGEKEYRGMGAYGTSKLCNILFTRELGRRLSGSGITANCFHPGFVDSNIGYSEAKGLMKPILRLMKLFSISAEKGADTLIYLATSPDVAQVSGAYFDRRKKIDPVGAGRNDDAAKKLWDLSVRLTGIDLT